MALFFSLVWPSCCPAGLRVAQGVREGRDLTDISGDGLLWGIWTGNVRGSPEASSAVPEGGGGTQTRVVALKAISGSALRAKKTSGRVGRRCETKDFGVSPG